MLIISFADSTKTALECRAVCRRECVKIGRESIRHKIASHSAREIREEHMMSDFMKEGMKFLLNVLRLKLYTRIGFSRKLRAVIDIIRVMALNASIVYDIQFRELEVSA